MLFVWDPAKAERNLAKHGIAFEEGRVAPMVRCGKQLSGS